MTNDTMTAPTPTTDRTATPATTRPRPVVAPRLDVVEIEDGYVVLADLPGVAADAIELESEGPVLRLRAPRATREREGTLVLSEIGTADYALDLRLPKDADTSRIEAELEHGVLELRVPKAESAIARRIEVRSGS